MKIVSLLPHEQSAACFRQENMKLPMHYMGRSGPQMVPLQDLVSRKDKTHAQLRTIFNA
uniref:Uncharacterized protein n=1 Tax=Rhizophora mucronata TaxID=61149 RepID=A0A2P2QRY7_RHIMU